MRNYGVAVGDDFKPLRHSYAVPPLLERRGYKWGFFIKFAKMFLRLP